ncbi:MAG: anthranilate phosphoribosyltransferase [Peptococcaceae bacterium]|nr:anthranilate phosphoribosyltransferase [Peptococcaceae bacterium]
MIRDAISKVVNGEHLVLGEAEAVMDNIMSGRATPAQVGALLVGLRFKGETVDEVTGFARVMRDKATPVRTKHRMIVDTCGTGGDGAHTFNISTTAAFVVAALGVPVAKHGNSSVSSRCGSADVLRALGANLELSPEQMGVCLDRVGISFLFAPRLHGAMKHAAGPRKEIGIRTVFNILGPLTNPALPQAQVLGVYDARVAELMAGVLAGLGVKRAFVVHGAGGLDEVSLAGPSRYWEVHNQEVISGVIDPQDLGFACADTGALAGGSPEENAGITRRVLAGEQGPRRDAVVLNAALALVAAGFSEDIPQAVEQASEAIDSGKAAAKLDEFIAFTRSLLC